MLKNLDSDYFFVVGYAGSGKSTYAKMLAVSLNANFIEASDIVKKVSKLQTRSDLASKTADLDQAIIEELRKVEKPAVVSGVRQVSILQAFEGNPIIWLSVPFEKREDRLTRRGSTKDNISLKEADDLDNKLGVGEVLNYIKDYHN